MDNLRLCVFVLACWIACFGGTVSAAELTATTFEVLAKRTPCPGVLPSSTHPYGNSLDVRWTNSCPGARAVEITFDPRSRLEWLCDYVYVTDASGANVQGSPFTGDELAGKRLVVPGDTVIARLDTDGAISEWGFAVLTMVGLEPDPAPVAVARDPLTLFWEVQHYDVQTVSGQWFDAVYVSTQSSWNSNAVPVVREFPPETAEASGSYFQWVTIETPGVATGDYYLILRSDGGSRVEETIETDNELAVPLRVENVDLAAIAFDAPTVAAPQQPISISWTVTNLSSHPALPYWYDYVYLRRGQRSNVVDWIYRDSLLPASGSYSVTHQFPLPALAAGTHRLEIHANAWGMAESIRQNNLLAASISIMTPDLVALSASAPGTVRAGEWFSASLVVSNGSTVVAYPPWYDGAYISSTNRWTAEALGIGQVGRYETVAPGILYTQQFQLNMPANRMGDLFLLLRVDARTNLFDANANNNVLAVPVRIQAADLVPIAFETGPSAVVAPNEPILLNWTLENRGSATANQGWFDRVLLATDPNGTNVVAEIGSFWQEEPLAPLASYSRSVTARTPPVPAGDYFLVLEIDGWNFQAEANEGNNSLSIPITITAADLAVESITAPASITVQQSFEVRWTVRNLGPSTAYPPWDDTLYIAGTNDVLQPLDYLMRLSAIDSLAPGAAYTQTQSVHASSWAAGDYFLVLNTEYPFFPPDTGASNRAAIPIRVEGPDLVALAITAPSAGLLQSNAQASVLISNAGPVTATAPWNVHFYVSYTNKWLPTAVYVGSAQASVTLAPGASTSVTAQLDFTSPPSGKRFLIARIDPIQLSDPNPHNNDVLTAITVRGPDLVPESFGVLGGYRACPGPFVQSPHPYPDTYVTVTNHSCPGADALKLIFDARSDTGFDTIEIMDGARRPVAGSPFTGYDLRATPVIVPGDNVIIQFVASHGSSAWGFAVTEIIGLRAVSNMVAAAQQTLDVQWQVRNAGDGQTLRNWRDTVALISTRGFPRLDEIANAFHARSLSAGESYLQHVVATLPSVKPGRYEMILRADGEYDIEEELEENNTRSMYIDIVSPDLAVVGLQAPSPLDGQSTFEIVWRVQNAGPVEAFPAWMDRLYVSATNRVSPEAIDISWKPHDVTLPPGSSYAVTQYVTLPALDAGNYYLVAKTDADSTLFDSFPDNNELAIPISIKKPDLKPTHFAPLVQGSLVGVPPQSAVNLSYTVENMGPGRAMSDWYDRIYFSRDGVIDQQDVALVDELPGQNPLNAGATYSRSVNVRIPGAPAGDYFLIFRANGWTNLAEVDFSNNALTLPIRLAAVDLELATLAATNEASPKQSIQTLWSVRNNGPAAAIAAWYDSFYLSTSPIWSPNAIFISKSWRNESLIAGNGYTASASLFIPEVAPGDYYLIARVDSENNLSDLNPTNNFRAMPIRVVSCDLVPLSLSELRANAACAGPFPETTNPVPRSAVLRWTNNCPGASNLQVTFDANSYVSYNSSFIAIMDKNGVPVSGSPFTGWIDPPRKLVPGDKVIIELSTGPFGNDHFRVTDISSVIETTNLFASPQSEIDVQWTVRNSGLGVASPQWADQFYLSTDSQLDSSDIFLDGLQISHGLAPGTSYRESMTLQIGAIPAGQYHLLLEVDGYDYHPEISETNNLLAVPITVGQPADLRAVSLNAPASIDTSHRSPIVNLTWTVTNQGAAIAATYWVDNVYLSRDLQLDAEDSPVASVPRLSALAPGRGYTATQSVTLHVTDGGPYYLLLWADGPGACQEGCVYESTETNNVIALPIQINLILPDLVVTELTAPPLVASNQEYPAVELRWVVRNQGPGAVIGSWNDNLYINGERVFSTYRNGPLAPGASYTNGIVEYLSLPSNNVYSVTIRTDDAEYCNCVPELVESNNSRSTSFQFVRSPKEVLFSGEYSIIPLWLATPFPVAIVEFDLCVPPGKLTDLTASYGIPALSHVTTTPAGNDRYHLRFETFLGEHLLGQQQISQLHFQAVPNQPSSFVPIFVSNVVARADDGEFIPDVSAHAGRVVVIGSQPLLEVTALPTTRHLITIYGLPGSNVVLETKISFVSGPWTKLWEGTLTNRFQHIGPYPTGNSMRFYRARY